MHEEGITITEQEMIDFCKERLGGFRYPRSVDFQTEALPLSGAGKILKNRLREPFWKGKEKQVN